MNDIIYFTFHFSDLEFALVILCVAFYLLEKKKNGPIGRIPTDALMEN